MVRRELIGPAGWCWASGRKGERLDLAMVNPRTRSEPPGTAVRGDPCHLPASLATLGEPQVPAGTGCDVVCEAVGSRDWELNDDGAGRHAADRFGRASATGSIDFHIDTTYCSPNEQRGVGQ